MSESTPRAAGFYLECDAPPGEDWQWVWVVSLEDGKGGRTQVGYFKERRWAEYCIQGYAAIPSSELLDARTVPGT